DDGRWCDGCYCDGFVARARERWIDARTAAQLASLRSRSDTDRSVCVEGGLRHGVRRRDGGVAGTAWVAVPFVVAPRRGWASVVFPRHTPERTRAARAQRRGNGTCSRRLRVGRGGPL